MNTVRRAPISATRPRHEGAVLAEPATEKTTMPRIRFHKLAAIVVLIGFAAWMGTGEFSSVGSVAANKAKAAEVEQGKAPDASKPKTAEAEPKAPLRTVAVVTPPRKTYARAIRISGLTEADKRAVLATRVAGVIDRKSVV